VKFNWFTPNKPADNTALWVIGAFWVLLFVVVWSTGAASFIPSPVQVAKAFPALWEEKGLGLALWQSMARNLEAMSLMIVASYLISLLTVMPFFRPMATLVSLGRFNGFVGMPLILMSIFHDHGKV